MNILRLSTLLLSASLAAQGAFVPFGTGCSWNGQALAIGSVGLPTIGTTFRVTYSGPNWAFNSAQQIAQPNLVIGFGQQVFPIPLGFLPQQPAGCTGYISPDIVVPTAVNRATGLFESFVDVDIPADPGLVGFAVYAQWLTVLEQCGFAGCGAAAFLTSDAAVVVLG